MFPSRSLRSVYDESLNLSFLCVSFLDFLTLPTSTWSFWTTVLATQVLTFSTGAWKASLFLSTILVKNLETLVSVSPSPLLIWVSQWSQYFKIRVAQHWGGRRDISVKKPVWRVNWFFPKIRGKLCLFQRFVTSILATLWISSHALDVKAKRLSDFIRNPWIYRRNRQK